jgi:hypothetical protein
MLRYIYSMKKGSGFLQITADSVACPFDKVYIPLENPKGTFPKRLTRRCGVMT